MTDYNPAHYRADGYADEPGAQIYCTQCPIATATVYVLNNEDHDDIHGLDRIINATRQHHDDDHEGKQP